MRLNPAEALVIWEKSHHRLSQAHRESFMQKVSASGLLAYESHVVRKALRQRKRLDASVTLAEELARKEFQSNQSGTGNSQRPAARPVINEMDWKPASNRSKKKSQRTSRRSGTKKPMENTDPYLSASGSGMVRNWGNRKPQPAVTSDERSMCKACDRPAMNCAC